MIKLLLRCLFFIVLLIRVSNVFGQSVSTTVQYNGAQANGCCTVCGNDYWCINNTGGCGTSSSCDTRAFFDPVPAGYTVTQVTINYYSAGCYGNSIAASINGSAFPSVNEANTGCLCSNTPCAVSATSTGNFPCGLPNYNYGANNNLQLCTGVDICMDRVELTLTYVPVGTTGAPAQPGAITGTVSGCTGTSLSFSISSVPNATSYTWTVPAGWSITSGQGSTSINTTVGGSAGNVCVTASNTCGTSAAACYAVSPSAISVAPTGASASPNPICSGAPTTLTVSGGTLGAGAVWNWYSGSCGGTLVGTGSSVSVSPVTGTTYYVLAQGTCNTTTCATVTVNMETPSTDPTGATATPTSICGGSSTLAVSGGTLGTGGVWNWYSGSCNGVLVGTGSSVSVSPGTTTTYFVNAVGTCNTSNCASVTLTVDVGATTNAGTDITSCGTTPFSLAGLIGGTASSLTWTTSGTGTFSNANSSTSTYTPSAGDVSLGSVTLTITTDDPPGACLAATDNLLLTFDQNATANAGTDNTICAGDSYTLSGSIGGSATALSWSTSGTGTFDNAAIGNAIYTPSGGDNSNGTVLLILTTNDPAGSCTQGIDTLVLTISTAPTTDAGLDNSICSGSGFSLAGSYGGSATSSAWTTSGTGTFNNPALPNAIYIPSGADISTGTVTLTITTNDPPGSCTAATDNLVLTIEQAATANAGNDTSLCSGGSYTLSGNIGGSATALNWTTSGTGNFNNPALPNATYTPSGGDFSLGTILLILTTNDPAGLCNSVSDTVILSIDSLDNAVFSFSPASYCQSATNPIPTISGLAGGTFSGSAGIIINPTTGEINLASSTIGGPYTITYLTNGTCPDSSTFNVFITTSPDATFSYTTTQYCQTDADPTPVIVPPASAGTFSASPSGLVFISATTGVIDLSASTPGIYVITNNIAAASGCPDTSATTTIEVVVQAEATINTAGPFCLGDSPVNMTAAQMGGTWSGTGITNPASGTFDPAVSGIGTHLITYDILGFCGNTDTVFVIVNSNSDATINPVGSLCSFDNPVSLTAAQTGGVWSGTGVSGNSFDPSISGPGTFVISYSIGGACGDTDTETVIVNASADATINPAGPFCTNDPPVNLTGIQSGGTWGGNGIINVNTGTFNPAVAGAGTHMITYIINSTCPGQDTVLIIVDPQTDASISTLGPYCNTAAPVTLSGTPPGGIWNGSGIIGNILYPNVPSPGSTYTDTISYSVDTSNCGNDVDTAVILLINTPDATINNPGALCDTTAPFSLNTFVVEPGGTWSGLVQSNGTFDPASIPDTINPALVIYTNSITMSNVTCSDVDSVYIYIGKVPPPPLTASDTACIDNVLELLAQDTSLLGTGVLNWWYLDTSGIMVLDTSNGLNTNSYLPVVSDSAGDSVYVFFVQEQNSNCPSAFSVCSLLVINIGASFTTNPLDSGEIPLAVAFSNTSFGADSTLDNFFWTFGDDDSSNYFNPTHTYHDTGVFSITLTVTDQFGVCIADTTYSIYAKGTSLAVPPNIFTPNGDGANDVFNLIHKNLSVAEGIIYNRWGELIYKWNSVEAGWDGKTLSGTDAPDGVYFYIIKAIGKDRPEPEQKTYEFTGTVTLVR